MNIQFTLLVLSVVLLIQPFALAKGPLSGSETIDVESSGTAKNETSHQVHDARSFPKAAAGVLAGLTIGIPVRISKDIRKETKRMAGTLFNDTGNEYGLLESAFVLGGAVPFGLLSGTIMGTVRGTERAVIYGADKPFCPESLGLKEPDPKPEPQ